MTATYDPKVNRRHLKAELSEYIKAAIEGAKNGLPQHEGSGNPTSRVIFYVRTTHEALDRFATLASEGWTLDTNSLCLLQKQGVPLSFTAIAPESYFNEHFLEKIVKRAEYDYQKEIDDHNKQAQKLRDRDDFIETEFKRMEEERLAQLRAQLAKEYDSKINPRYVNSEATQLHAR
ncbi:hypothetical protein [Pseudomonas gingeri]